MTFVDTDRKGGVEQEQELELELLMDFLLADRVMLLSETDRKKLQGAQIPINDVKDTSSGQGVVQEVEFTIINAATFMWDRRRPAAIAIGRIKGQKGLLLTGAVFSPRSLERAGVDARDVASFPALISEMPGHFNEFTDSLGFYVTMQSPRQYDLTLGGEHPESLVSRQISGPNKIFQTVRSLNTAVGMNVSRI